MRGGERTPNRTTDATFDMVSLESMEAAIWTTCAP